MRRLALVTSCLLATFGVAHAIACGPAPAPETPAPVASSIAVPSIAADAASAATLMSARDASDGSSAASAEPPPPPPNDFRVLVREASLEAYFLDNAVWLKRENGDEVRLKHGGTEPATKTIGVLPLGGTGEMTMNPKPSRSVPVERRRELTRVFGRAPGDVWAVTSKGFDEIAFWAGELFFFDGAKWKNQKTLAEGSQFGPVTLWRNHALAWMPKVFTPTGGLDGALAVYGFAPLPRAPALARATGKIASPKFEGLGCHTKVVPQAMLGFPTGELFVAGWACDDATSGPAVQSFAANGAGRVDVIARDVVSEGTLTREPVLAGDSPSHVCIAWSGYIVGENVTEAEADEPADDSGPRRRAIFATYDGRAWRSFAGPVGAGARVVDLACPHDGDTWAIMESRDGRGLHRKHGEEPWTKVATGEWNPEGIFAQDGETVFLIGHAEDKGGKNERRAALEYAPPKK
jgi:hypothetical protein